MNPTQSCCQVLGCLFLTSTMPLIAAAATQPQTRSGVALATQIESSPTLPFKETHFAFHFPAPTWKLGAVSGVAADAKGNIYVIQRGSQADPILVFDRDGNLLHSWGRADFTLPHTLRLDPSGKIWAVDAGSSQVIEYTPTGRKLLTLPIHPVPDNGSPFHGATDLAFAPNGRIFLTDGYANARVLEFTATGKQRSQWGHPGTGPAQFHLPHAIEISPSGTIYIADRENGRIEKFDLTGHFLGQIDHLGRCYALKLDHGILWATTSPMNQPPGAPGWLLKLDPRTGQILGHLRIPDDRAGHALDILPSGALILTAGNGLLLFQP